MGLDGIELIMAVEEEFKIAIADVEAASCTTVGKLVELVFSRLKQNEGVPCPSQHGFYVVRRKVREFLDLGRFRVRPETRLDELIGRTDRRQVWCGLMDSLAGQKTTWPSLVRPRWLTGLVCVAIPAMAWIGVTGVMGFYDVAFPIVIGWGAAMVTSLLGGLLTIPFRREFPREFSQVKDLIKLVTTLDSRTWSEDEVFQKIRVITAEQLGVEKSRVTWDAEFVNDLGAG